ncbi:DUF58 domain-containing protein, partial [Micromonospora sp. NPDC003776]
GDARQAGVGAADRTPRGHDGFSSAGRTPTPAPAGGYRTTAPPRPGDPAPGLADGLAGVQRMATRRGLVVIVSDFLDGLPDDPAAAAPWEALLRRLAVRHQVLAVEVTDPRELELPDVGLVTLVDPETGRHREVWTGDRDLRERYAEAAAAQRDQVRQALRRSGATHLALRTDRDWSADIVRHVHTQRRLAAAPAATRGGTA